MIILIITFLGSPTSVCVAKKKCKGRRQSAVYNIFHNHKLTSAVMYTTLVENPICDMPKLSVLSSKAKQKDNPLKPQRESNLISIRIK